MIKPRTKQSNKRRTRNKRGGKPGSRTSLKGRLTNHRIETTFGLERSPSATFQTKRRLGAIRGMPPLPGETHDDLKIKDIEMKRDLLNNDSKFQMIFRWVSTLPHVNIPRKPYEECIKLYDKWTQSGKAEDAPSETSFYIYKNNSQKLSHLEWSYNEYIQQKEHEPSKGSSKKHKKNKDSSKKHKKKNKGKRT